MSVMDVMKLLFFGILEDNKYSELHMVISLLFLFSIWKCRNNKKISYATVENNMAFYYKGILEVNKELYDYAKNSNYLWCRNWNGDKGDGGVGLRDGHG